MVIIVHWISNMFRKVTARIQNIHLGILEVSSPRAIVNKPALFNKLIDRNLIVCKYID